MNKSTVVIIVIISLVLGMFIGRALTQKACDERVKEIKALNGEFWDGYLKGYQDCVDKQLTY